MLSCDQWITSKEVSDEMTEQDLSIWFTEHLPVGVNDVPPHAVMLSSLSYWISSINRTEGFDAERNLACTSGQFGSLSACVPGSAQPGDHLCYFTGVPFPFVVRARGDGTFQLLGDAFVHGVEELELVGLERSLWIDLLDELAVCDAATFAYEGSDDDKSPHSGRSSYQVSDIGSCDDGSTSDADSEHEIRASFKDTLLYHHVEEPDNSTGQHNILNRLGDLIKGAYADMGYICLT